MNIHVLKFGGTSMNDHKTWKQVLEIIKQYEYPVVVVSATANTTRKLVEAATSAAKNDLDKAFEISKSIKSRHLEIIDNFLEENPHPKKKLIKESCEKKINEKIGLLNKLLTYTDKVGELTPKMKDAIASIGEQISSYLLAQCGLATDQLTQFVDARKIIKTDDSYGKANPNFGLISQKINSLETIMDGGFTPIVGGFYGEATNGTITTLGFEGSDYSASLIGGALHAKVIEIWTDVSGVFTSDPRYIAKAKPINELSYYDATEMAFWFKGTSSFYFKACARKKYSGLGKNMFRPEDNGTKIIRDVHHERKALAISFKDNIVLLTVSAYETIMGFNFLTKVFSVLEEYRLAVDAVNTTEASVTIALSKAEHLEKIAKSFIEIGTVKIDEQKGLISIIGCQFSSSNKLISEVLDPIKETNIDMISFTHEKKILNLAIAETDLISTAEKIHNKLFQ